MEARRDSVTWCKISRVQMGILRFWISVFASQKAYIFCLAKMLLTLWLEIIHVKLFLQHQTHCMWQ